MSVLHSLILGIVEGISEFLPISSTGHLILFARVLSISQTDFVKSFEIAIQLGAILSVVLLYAKRVWGDTELIKKIIAGFLPTGVLGFAFYKVVKTYLLGSSVVVVWALFIGGAALIVFEFLHAKSSDRKSLEEISHLSYGRAMGIGCFQAIAMVPGVSRSAATIIGGMAMGLSRRAALEFSFLLAVPTMAAATGLDLIKSANEFASADMMTLVIGFIASFVVAWLSVKWLLSYVQSHTFVFFGAYRIVAALAFWFFVLR